MKNKILELKKNLKSVISGKEEIIDLVIIALFAGGNILMEDVPGVGKTTLAKTLAKSIDGTFHRVQFTPDLLPTDIVGSSVYNPKDASFHFRKGPIFSNILLADEINRASPRTQSALLEAMNEDQVTAEGITYQLPHPFLVIATENPVEYYGTYPLPEAQLDRFAVQIIIGYPDEKSEMEILFARKEKNPLDEIQHVITCPQVSDIQHLVRTVQIEESLASYMLKIIRATRSDPRVKLGASPRAFLMLARTSQARAFVNNRDFIIPDDIKSLAPSVLAHRIVLDNKTKHSGTSKQSIINDILKKTDVPV